MEGVPIFEKGLHSNLSALPSRCRPFTLPSAASRCSAAPRWKIDFPQFSLSLPARCDQKGTKVTLPALRSGLIEIIEIEMIRNSFPNTKQFPQPREILCIGNGQVNQLQCALKSPAADFGAPLLFPGYCPFNFASYIRHLFGEGEQVPSARRQFSVLMVHRITRLLTIRRMRSRIAGSSTPRLRFPREGRRLIIESNSTKSSPSSAGYRLTPQRSV